MAKPKLVTAAADASPMPPKLRKALEEIAIQASYEIEALAALLTEKGLDHSADDS